MSGTAARHRRGRWFAFEPAPAPTNPISNVILDGDGSECRVQFDSATEDVLTVKVWHQGYPGDPLVDNSVAYGVGSWAPLFGASFETNETYVASVEAPGFDPVESAPFLWP